MKPVTLTTTSVAEYFIAKSVSSDSNGDTSAGGVLSYEEDGFAFFFRTGRLLCVVVFTRRPRFRPLS